MTTVLNPHFVASQGGYSRDRAIGVHIRMGSTSAVCVNDWEMARYILARGGVPILRIRAPEDDDADARFDPVEYVDTCHTQLSVAENGIAGAALKGIVHIGNELGSANPERTAQWLATAINRATFHRRKAIAANWSIKNPADHMHPILARFGVYDAIRVNGGEIGYHEGAYIDPNTGDVYRTFEQCIAGGAIGGWQEAAKRYGFRVRITEFAASKTPVDGWSTWMSETEFAALCDKAGQFYAAQGIAAHIYTAFKWDRGTGFEYVDVPTLQDKFAYTNRSYPVTQPTNPPTPPVQPPTEGGTTKALADCPNDTHINVRQQPNAASPTSNPAPDVGDLLIGDIVKIYDEPANLVGQWAYVEVIEQVPRNGLQPAVNGWVSLQNGAVSFVPPVLPEPPAETTYSMTEAERLVHLDRLTRAIDDLVAARAFVEGLQPSTDGGL